MSNVFLFLHGNVEAYAYKFTHIKIYTYIFGYRISTHDMLQVSRLLSKTNLTKLFLYSYFLLDVREYFKY